MYTRAANMFKMAKNWSGEYQVLVRLHCSPSTHVGVEAWWAGFPIPAPAEVPGPSPVLGRAGLEAGRLAFVLPLLPLGRGDQNPVWGEVCPRISLEGRGDEESC